MTGDVRCKQGSRSHSWKCEETEEPLEHTFFKYHRAFCFSKLRALTDPVEIVFNLTLANGLSLIGGQTLYHDSS